MVYLAGEDRYESMKYNRTGRSGLKLPAISLGLWHNFGGINNAENGRSMITRSFDLGITHFDLANNYGPPAGSAEEFFGQVLASDMKPYRDELVISTKAGYHMWAGPYGDWGSRKYMISSLDQSLKRMGLDYVDIFYSHRFDPNTPLEETMGALDHIVRSGKALYVGVSNYSAEQTAEAARILKELGTPMLIHQPRYSLLDRWIENGLQDVLDENGIGSIAFCPLAQGLLTNKYLNGIPEDSRAASTSVFLNENHVTPETLRKVRALNQMAAARGQSLAQFSLAWALRGERLTSVLIGASRVSQIEENVKALSNLEFSQEELDRIDSILNAGHGQDGGTA
ncbi:L-glyceraldehyde 3-phosphate reductase [Paenibacillus ottowii]|uniref:L-glyceraldehyde 3-phosphate reductase n=1 Tax=Paenibacillus ottowii TaxID=2315729 RepID=A0ABY3B7K1_9BACL|nr:MULTISPECIES: L-glyceraldehyde 3-phosphate reductase [Paenibacillus]NEU28942.1 L-glyceraldehyde 3-phosphate reductase [Paenibacillus polymyxa]OBA04824.1 L-glyceraldehyde 3-phosphate reductase [Paenibacillus polymyxa]TQR98328.1 L-glyceraldehyde 3-phosphate reductase [Paenibacillus ottowii]